jgi:disulfide bond formation protein DsbB
MSKITPIVNVVNIKKRIFFLNILEILGIYLILIFALGFQIILQDLPCPLCLLQRIGFFGIALGLLMNLRFGLHPSHYSIALVSALFTSFVALRHIALHIVPGSGTYGQSFLGLHLYTWSFIAAVIILLYTSIILGIDRQYQNSLSGHIRSHWSTYILLAFTALLFVINIVSLLIQCGIGVCPEIKI